MLRYAIEGTWTTLRASLRSAASRSRRLTSMIAVAISSTRPGAVDRHDPGDPAHPLPLVGGVAAGADDDALARLRPRAALRSRRARGSSPPFARRRSRALPAPPPRHPARTSPRCARRSAARARRAGSRARRSPSGAGSCSPRGGRRRARATRPPRRARARARGAAGRWRGRPRPPADRAPASRACAAAGSRLDLGQRSAPARPSPGGGGTSRSASAARR